MPTKFAFTGQREDGFGLMDYHARFYSPRLGRFISADSVVANLGNAKRFDRYAYTRNNPLKYVDPTGHLDGVPWWEQGFDTLDEPVFIYPGIYIVNLADSIYKNKLGAQYYPINSPGIPLNQYNLCGDIALEVIYETVTGEKNALEKIYKASPSSGYSARGPFQGTDSN